MIARRLTRKQKDTILDRDAHICYYCGGIATVVDHIIPWNWAHNDNPDNLVASCALCNSIAGDKLFDTIEDKRKHILRARKHRHKQVKHGVFRCNQCGQEFIPCVNGATNFVCSACVEDVC